MNPRMCGSVNLPPDSSGPSAYGEQVRDTLNFLNIRGC
jgi:hypothetical protein